MHRTQCALATNSVISRALPILISTLLRAVLGHCTGWAEPVNQDMIGYKSVDDIPLLLTSSVLLTSLARSTIAITRTLLLSLRTTHHFPSWHISLLC
jgi:hypothetical protein